jgi:hypothetical protein
VWNFIIFTRFALHDDVHRGGVMMARPGPVEPKPSAGRGRRLTSCEACRLVKRKCEGGVPCDRYEPLAHSVDLPIQESRQTGRVRAPSNFKGVSNLVRCDNVAWRVQVHTNQKKMCTGGSGWNLGAKEAFAGIWDRKWGRWLARGPCLPSHCSCLEVSALKLCNQREL